MCAHLQADRQTNNPNTGCLRWTIRKKTMWLTASYTLYVIQFVLEFCNLSEAFVCERWPEMRKQRTVPSSVLLFRGTKETNIENSCTSTNRNAAPLFLFCTRPPIRRLTGNLSRAISRWIWEMFSDLSTEDVGVLVLKPFPYLVLRHVMRKICFHLVRRSCPP